jgi:hypothetical protein
MALQIWSCSEPTPRPPQGDFTVGMFRRGEPIPARELWPGSVESWSCNTGRFPGHLDLVLYLGGAGEADRTRQAILAAELRRETARLAHEKFQEAEATRRAAGRFTRAERWSLAQAQNRARDEERARREAAAAERLAAARKAAAERLVEELENRHRFDRDFRAKLGRRVRRIFHVSRAGASHEGASQGEPGWYVNTVRPPPEWMNNDPLGPFPTLAALLRDVVPAYMAECE